MGEVEGGKGEGGRGRKNEKTVHEFDTSPTVK